MSRYIVVAPNLTEAEELAFKAELGPNTGWWHQLEGTWLIVDTTGSLSPDYVMSALEKIAPRKEVAVFEVTPHRWQTRLHTHKHEANGAWMARHWESV